MSKALGEHTPPTKLTFSENYLNSLAPPRMLGAVELCNIFVANACHLLFVFNLVQARHLLARPLFKTETNHVIYAMTHDY